METSYLFEYGTISKIMLMSLWQPKQGTNKSGDMGLGGVITKQHTS